MAEFDPSILPTTVVAPPDYRLAYYVAGEVLLALLALLTPGLSLSAGPVLIPIVLIPAVVGAALGSWAAFRIVDRQEVLWRRTLERALLTAFLSLVIGAVPFVFFLYIAGFFIALAVGAVMVGTQAVVYSLLWSLAHSLLFERKHLRQLTPPRS